MNTNDEFLKSLGELVAPSLSEISKEDRILLQVMYAGFSDINNKLTVLNTSVVKDLEQYGKRLDLIEKKLDTVAHLYNDEKTILTLNKVNILWVAGKTIVTAIALALIGAIAGLLSKHAP